MFVSTASSDLDTASTSRPSLNGKKCGNFIINELSESADEGKQATYWRLLLFSFVNSNKTEPRGNLDCDYNVKSMNLMMKMNLKALALALIDAGEPLSRDLESSNEPWILAKYYVTLRHLFAKAALFKLTTDLGYSYYALNYQQMRLMTSGDIETNPGPVSRTNQSPTPTPTPIPTLKTLTYNVRGLSDEAKLRHLVNYCYNEMSLSHVDFIAGFQETYIEESGIIPYIWRGNYLLTPGNGHSSGCLTLLSNHLNVISSRHLANRAHVAVVQRSDEKEATYVIANVYAPCAHNRAKIDFVTEILDQIFEYEETYNCRNLLLLGDFNLIFQENESRNRQFTAAEKKTSKVIAKLMEDATLKDSWNGGKAKFTWRRANTETFSCLDRIFFRDDQLVLLKIDTNWAVSSSDHALVCALYRKRDKVDKPRSRFVRLDGSIFKNEQVAREIFDEVALLLNQSPDHWDPHMKLEFAKISIRTVVERAQAQRKKQEATAESALNEEIEIIMDALESGELSTEHKGGLLDHLEDLRAQKLLLVEEKGKRLAEKVGTKWYNEGEKSTRYFLRLLNRNNPDKFNEVEKSTGELTNDASEIEKEIVNFYKALYENYDKTNLVINESDSFFNNITPVSANENDLASNRITLTELEQVLRTTQDSAPGPDGIPYSILRHLWPLIGPIILNAWNHSLDTGNLCQSHKLSYLKLIPKAGKDLKKLTNWRPITLSNCDHKLITKAYANRLSNIMQNYIVENQTAYLRGRQISDNVRTILSAINSANEDPDIDGLLISLDARKAFDSVDHEYIEICLKKFGLESFIPIFKTLYKDLQSDIIVNGVIVKGFKILRGVKQGDALSCILFIMCMEPLIRNIESNPLIEKLSNTIDNIVFPKVAAYADDLNSMIKNTIVGINELFREYERLSINSGLQLNADKTEAMRLKIGNPDDNTQVFRVRYMGTSYRIRTVGETKINGIVFQMNESNIVTDNVDKAITKMEQHFKSWSRRGLSTLGKILITKTYGISMLIHVLQSLVISDKETKRINACLYKFIWNRHYSASKAPERIKREIVNKPIKLGGFGMLSIVELDAGLKLRALGRLLETKHPLLLQIKAKVDLDSFFHPNVKTKIDKVTAAGIELLKIDRKVLLNNRSARNDIRLVRAIRAYKIKNLINERGKQSITYLLLRRAGKSNVGDLDNRSLASLKPFFIEKQLYEDFKEVVNIRTDVAGDQEKRLYPVKGKLLDICAISSKLFREARTDLDQICVFKNGLILDPSISVSYMNRIRTLTSVKHRNNLLRLLHGDIYTNSRLVNFGLKDDPICERCDEIDTLEHRLGNCPGTNPIFETLVNLTDRVRVTIDANETTLEKILLANNCPCMGSLTLHAEVLKIALNTVIIRQDPKSYLIQILKNLLKREDNVKVKRELKSLLDLLLND